MTRPMQQPETVQSPGEEIQVTEWADDLILSDEQNTEAWLMCPKEDTVEIQQ